MLERAGADCVGRAGHSTQKPRSGPPLLKSFARSHRLHVSSIRRWPEGRRLLHDTGSVHCPGLQAVPERRGEECRVSAHSEGSRATHRLQPRGKAPSVPLHDAGSDGAAPSVPSESDRSPPNARTVAGPSASLILLLPIASRDDHPVLD
jgi:hypothetical protein